MSEDQVTKAQPLFDRFLTEAGLNNAEAGRQLGASAAIVLWWRRGDKRPADFYRAKIERWTRRWSRGPILAHWWRTDDEADDIAAIRPYPVERGGPRRPRVASPATRSDAERRVA